MSTKRIESAKRNLARLTKTHERRKDDFLVVEDAAVASEEVIQQILTELNDAKRLVNDLEKDLHSEQNAAEKLNMRFEKASDKVWTAAERMDAAEEKLAILEEKRND